MLACAGGTHVSVQDWPWRVHRWIAAYHPFPCHSSEDSTVDSHMGPFHLDDHRTYWVAAVDTRLGEDIHKACLGLRTESAVVG